MKVTLTYNGKDYTCDLNQPLDISIPLGQVRCFYAGPFKTEPFQSGDFIGSVGAGAPVNFYNVQVNPHGHGTHTECLGHLTHEHQSIDQMLQAYHFTAQLISIPIVKAENGDAILSLDALKQSGQDGFPEALIIRTLPNKEDKLTMDYSGTNPPYLTRKAMQFIVDHEVKHLLLDLPSVDPESDGGQLIAHRIFWQLKEENKIDPSRQDCTITELIYVPNTIADGMYLLNLQIPSLQLDAAPSKPVIYKLNQL